MQGLPWGREDRRGSALRGSADCIEGVAGMVVKLLYQKGDVVERGEP